MGGASAFVGEVEEDPPGGPEGSGLILRVTLRPTLAVRRLAIACTIGSVSSPTFAAAEPARELLPCWSLERSTL